MGASAMEDLSLIREFTPDLALTEDAVLNESIVGRPDQSTLTLADLGNDVFYGGIRD